MPQSFVESRLILYANFGLGYQRTAPRFPFKYNYILKNKADANLQETILRIQPT